MSEPNNIGGVENCVAMNKAGFWRDVPCTDKLDIVCQMACTNATSVADVGSGGY